MICKECNIEKTDDSFPLLNQKLRSGEYKVYRRHTCRACESIKSCIRSQKRKAWLTPESKKKTNKYLKRRFFYTRANRIRKEASKRQINCPYSSKELMLGLSRQWKLQRGYCVLSGIKLTEDNAELDHIIPLSRCGQSTLDNLRWITKDVNRMKQNLLDKELLELISRVMEYSKVVFRPPYRKQELNRK